MTVHCKACGHQWEIAFKLPMKLSKLTKMMRAFSIAGCPGCGADGPNVLMGPADKPPAAPPAIAVPVEQPAVVEEPAVCKP